MTVDLRGVGYAAGRISSTLKGRTKQFGWLQAPATIYGFEGLYWRSPQFPNHRIATVLGLKFFRETSFALSLSCLLIADGRSAGIGPARGCALPKMMYEQ